MRQRALSPASRRLAGHFDNDASFDLVEAALLVAQEEYPTLDAAEQTARVHAVAGEAARRAGTRSNPFERYDPIRELLFEELGFRGNVQDYHDPRNSFLNDVLDRRLGIPLTLSILVLECARAAGFAARGVALPGHVVVRLELERRRFFVDPFGEGRVVTEEDCRSLVRRTTGRPSLFRREHLLGVPDRALICRMLLNLKHVYVSRKDYRRALSAVERLLLARPEAGELRDRGLIKAHLGMPGAAVEDLERYLARTPEAPDATSVRGRVAWLRRQLPRLN